MKTYTVQCEFPSLDRNTVTVVADNPEAAALAAISAAGMDDGWEAIDFDQPIYVVAMAEGDDVEPWGSDADGFDISVIPVPLIASRRTRLSGYTCARADDLLAMLRSLTSALSSDAADRHVPVLIANLRADAIDLIGDIDRVGQPEEPQHLCSDSEPPADRDPGHPS